MSTKTNHDGSYRQLFSNPEMVTDLLQTFVGQDIAAQLDLAHMERVDTSFRSENLTKRDADIIWKIPRHQHQTPLYLYLMLEFQSTIDTGMALRLLVYIGLLYQQLEKQSQRKQDFFAQGLPPVLPIVLYNGTEPWHAPTEFQQLYRLESDSPLWAFQPQFRYHLIDEFRLPRDELAQQQDLASLLFQMEQSRDNEELAALVSVLIERLQGPAFQKLREAFLAWLGMVGIPARGLDVSHTQIDSLAEVRDVLRDKIQQWLEDSYSKGKAEGEAKGKAEGEAKGKAEGEAKGKAEGRRIVLSKLLQLKFGDSSERQTRLGTLDEAQLTQLEEKILFAESEQVLFETLDLNNKNGN